MAAAMINLPDGAAYWRPLLFNLDIPHVIPSAKFQEVWIYVCPAYATSEPKRYLFAVCSIHKLRTFPSQYKRCYRLLDAVGSRIAAGGMKPESDDALTCYRRYVEVKFCQQVYTSVKAKTDQG